MNTCMLLCTSVTCQPKCQNAVGGCVAGGALTLLKSTNTSLVADNAGCPAKVVFDVVGNCFV